MPHPPISPEDRLAIVELADSGASVREIARELGLASSTVSRNAKRMGVRFDRAATVPATDARIEDARRKRSIAAHRAINDALTELDRLHQPCRVVGVVGGMNAGVHEKVLPRPPAAERQAIVRNFNTLIATHMTLVEADLGNDATNGTAGRAGPSAAGTTSGRPYARRRPVPEPQDRRQDPTSDDQGRPPGQPGTDRRQAQRR